VKENGNGRSDVLKNGKCLECGAWTDSYGLVHDQCCSGGFHEEEGKCPCEDGGKKRKRK